MDLTCAICLDTHLELVVLSCGHRVCRDCIQEKHLQDHCPLCHTQAMPEEERPEVQCEEKGESFGQQDGVILCDFCLQEPQPAVKTCMNCEASLCQAHLSKHNTKSPLKEHVLMEPCEAQVLAERRCRQHGRLLECYCATDSVCICMLCCIVSYHKDHKIITLEEAFDKAQGFFTETLEAVKTHEAALDHSIENLLKQEEEVKNEEGLRKDRLESLFKEMCLQLGDRKEEVLKVLSHNEEQQLSWIQTKMQKHKEEKDAASHDVQELEALRDQKDLLLFIKAFSAIQARERKPVSNCVDLKPTPPIILDKLTTDGTLRLFQEFLSDMQSLFKSPPVREYLTTSVDKKGTYAFEENPFPVSPRRLPGVYKVGALTATTPQLKSNESFSEGCHFWEVDTSNMRHWLLGIGCSRFDCYLEATSHNLCLFLDKTLITGKHYPEALKVIRVEVDCGRNRLSFYKVSVKDGNTTASLHLLEAVTIPFSYPVHAIFKIFEGSLKLL
ncbi:E3 ubiquitin/ISG15 ligase TRIM25-like [Melopsittacus undulatus]|uniref:Uncharacterized protein n=1 Tax=Melopsittacus undulatus TaxID=13146 RepID=A0A8V5G9Y9_MELUD|nr:E3 ubiquitin/ISG15 ligase TRIM25-like [Melopsittacus undulatus]